MKLSNISSTIGGWFVGDFENAAYRTADFEVAYKEHHKGEHWDKHYHTEIVEVNLLIEGEMTMHGKHLKSGDIFILHPYEIADPEFLSDCKIVVVKHPGIVNDKIIF